jgi:trk system potassium uptake protein TrkA
LQTIIVGAGKLGYKLAESLSQKNDNVIVIDVNQEALDKVNDHLDVLTVNDSGLNMEMLTRLNISKCHLLIAVTSSDEINMLVASMAKKMGCYNTIARIRNPEYSNQIEFIKREMNIDYVVNPDLATSKEIAKYLLKGQAIHMEDFAQGKVGMADFKANNLKDIIGKKIKDLNIPQNVLIAAISRNGATIIPNGETEIESTDIIYVIGKKESINQFSKNCGSLIGHKHVKKVIILGGGKIGYYLANNLIEHGVAVKIIERDKKRSQYLAENINGGLVIHGDGTDTELLLEEKIADMDAFVTVTGYDEENLLLGLLAKQNGVPKVIAKVSRPNYIPIIEKLGIDIAVNPVYITASDILRYIQGGKVVSISLLLGGDAEVLEIIATKNSQIIHKKLKDLQLPKGIIVGAIVHKGKVIIPNGDSEIVPGDRVIVFSLHSEVPKLEKLFGIRGGGIVYELFNSSKGSRQSINF